VFESLRPDPGQDGLTRAARIFYVAAVISFFASVVFVALRVAGDVSYTPFRLATDFGFAALAFITGRGVAHQRSWAKWLGYTFGTLELVNVPIGTVIGAAAIIYIYRASRAGLFG